MTCCDRHAFVRPPHPDDWTDQLDEQRAKYHYLVAYALPFDRDTEDEL